MGRLAPTKISQSARFCQQRLNPAGTARDMEEIYRDAAGIPLLHGLELIVRPDDEMGLDYARAHPANRPTPPRVFVRQSVINASRRMHARSRFTLAHELAHVVLHATEESYARLSVAIDRLKFRTSRQSVEDQADQWAAEFLMPTDLVSKLTSVQQVMDAFAVSFKAAERRFREVVERERPKIVPLEVINTLRELSPRPDLRSEEEALRLNAWRKASVIPGENPDFVRISADAVVVQWDQYRQSHARGWFFVGDQVFSWKVSP